MRGSWALEPQGLLFSWIDAPDCGTALQIYERGGYKPVSSAELASAVRRGVGGLASVGIERGERVVLALPAGVSFAQAFFGCLLLGATAVPLAPPGLFRSEEFRSHLARALASAGSRIVVAERRDVDAVRSAAPVGVTVIVAEDLDLAAASDQRNAPPEVAVLQLTSGSTGAPKAVRVGFDHLDRHIRSIADSMEPTPDDAMSTWLPVHHDMGLVAAFVAPICHRVPIYLMQPADFIRNPLAWLRTFGEGLASITLAPPFGLNHVLRRVRPSALEGLDFSVWRALIVGAERIDARVASRFLTLLRPLGLRSDALCPAYGMAEATLGVTVKPIGGVARVAALRDGGRIDVCRIDELDAPIWDEDDPGTLVVGCGTTIDVTSVEVLNDDGHQVPDGVVGEILVRGDTLALGYTGPAAADEVDFDGRFATGDSGFLMDGELFVLGRLGDAVKVRAEMVMAEDVELALARLPEVGGKGVCVLLGNDRSGARAVVLVERRLGEAAKAAVDVAARRAIATEAVDVSVLAVSPRQILRTTSGKPRRKEMWRAHLDGTFVGLDEAVGADR